MAVLEAFVYDPLLNWRLLDTAADKSRRSKNNVGAAADNVTTAANSLGSNEEGMDLLSFGGGNNQRTNTQSRHDDEAQNYLHPAEATNKKARMIVDRVKQKLTGNDFNTNDPIDVHGQVDLLIQQATNNENLCQCYIGWCPFW